MIKIDKYNEILDAGLLLDHFILLCNMRDCEPMSTNKRMEGFRNLLCKRGYIYNDELTDKAFRLIGDNIVEEVITTSSSTTSTSTMLDTFDYGKWVLELHKKCREKLIEHTGKGQVRDFIASKQYPFLPNSTDLGHTILRTVKAYKLSDFDKIEKTILRYIDSCAKAKNWFPILGYYIMKNGVSTLVTDMLTDTDDIKSDDTSVNI